VVGLVSLRSNTLNVNRNWNSLRKCLMYTTKNSTRVTFTRRRFLATSAAMGISAQSMPVFGDIKEANHTTATQTLHWEAPIIHRTDVLVCGGGPAGCAAAIYAARAGAKTMLLENMPFLGGVWTVVGVSHYIQGHDRDGFNAELHERLPVHKVFGRNIYILEDMKCELDQLMGEAGAVHMSRYLRSTAAMTGRMPF